MTGDDNRTALERARRSVYRDYARLFRWLVRQGCSADEAAYSAATLIGQMCGYAEMFGGEGEEWKR